MIAREMIANDTFKLLKLFNDSIHLISSKDYSLEQINAWAPLNRSLEDWEKSFEKKTIYVVEENTEILGFSEIEEDGHIDRFYTSASHQGIGVGKLMLCQIEDRAKSLGIQRLFVEASITAKPFFEKRGFAVIEEQRVVLREVEFINFRMEKFI